MCRIKFGGVGDDTDKHNHQMGTKIGIMWYFLLQSDVLKFYEGDTGYLYTDIVHVSYTHFIHLIWYI